MSHLDKNDTYKIYLRRLWQAPIVGLDHPKNFWKTFESFASFWGVPC